MILAGDIGGTKTNVAMFEIEPSGANHGVGKILTTKSFPSGQYPSLDSILTEFLAANKHPIDYAGFGIAGPIKAGVVRTPNLPWVVDAQVLAKLLGCKRVELINDLEATAYGIDLLKSEQFYTLNVGEEVEGGNRALIAAGTGLGMAGLFRDQKGYHPIASEGGHAEFAPQNELDIKLFMYLQKKFSGHVSYERVLSGPGLFNIYCFLRDEKIGDEDAWLAQEISAGDKTSWAASVAKAGGAGKSKMAVQAVDLFTRFYGAAAGNLALMMKSLGGLYIGGGIAPKMLEKLKDGSFMKAFTDKGRLAALVGHMPVRVILDDKTALYGAARSAIQPDR